MDLAFILPFLATVLVVFIILKILSLPMKLIIKLLINALIGAIVIWLINLIGANFDFSLTLNWVTALIVGILGIPGVIILLIWHFLA